MRESKYKSYQDLPLTLTAPEVAEVLGISRAAAYELVRSKGFPPYEDRNADLGAQGQVLGLD